MFCESALALLAQSSDEQLTALVQSYARFLQRATAWGCEPHNVFTHVAFVLVYIAFKNKLLSADLRSVDMFCTRRYLQILPGAIVQNTD